MGQRRNARGDLRENPPTSAASSGTIPTCENPGWEASSLTAQGSCLSRGRIALHLPRKLRQENVFSPTHATNKQSKTAGVPVRVKRFDLESRWGLLSVGMKGRGKREIPEKTRRPTASSGTIPTCENPDLYTDTITTQTQISNTRRIPLEIDNNCRPLCLRRGWRGQGSRLLPSAGYWCHLNMFCSVLSARVSGTGLVFAWLLLAAEDSPTGQGAGRRVSFQALIGVQHSDKLPMKRMKKKQMKKLKKEKIAHRNPTRIRLLRKLPKPQKSQNKPSDRNISRVHFKTKIDVKHVYTEVDYVIGSQFIRHALHDSEPIADLQGNKERGPYCHGETFDSVIAERVSAVLRGDAPSPPAHTRRREEGNLRTPPLPGSSTKKIGGGGQVLPAGLAEELVSYPFPILRLDRPGD
ncbi:hypothetical protein PR048_002779 [Dryococelus australis]|uniref:Uncharacterized protein n=1 Tax=Dryococelus australis TaxID=614101 RepID=A0ABQ9IL51_9NEOP|nr:hypothetical protein PR048_002779 [Dryococelus australis]